MKRIVHLALILLIGVLAGCASPGSIVPNTTTADELSKRLGTPTDKRSNPNGGEFWDYAYGPEGTTTWRFGIDGSRMVRSVEQLLTEERLHKVVPGVTNEAGVLDLLGRPRLVTRYGHETAWEWRADLSPNKGVYIVRFGLDGKALGVGVLLDTQLDGSVDP